jgi:hypothetical protein
MCSSIREFGFKIPVLARSDGEVVDGHLRLKASRKLGITEVPLSSAVPHDDPALDRILDDVHESFCRQLSQPDRESLTTELERIVSDAERSR